jgi:hypothetical protein
MKSLITALWLGLIPTFLFAQVPQTLSYQGVLTDLSGNAVPDGNYTLTFKLYDVSTGGSAVWTESQPVTVSKGIMNVILGKVSALNLGFDRAYWLGITVNSGTEMAPRMELSSNAYAFMSKTVTDSAVTGGKIAGHTLVRSLNGLNDHVKIAGGSNITIQSAGDSLII